jgi:hypothetical protein
LNLAQLDDLTCAVLREESPNWPSTCGDDLETIFIRRTQYQGVTALLHERLQRLSAWPYAVREAVRQHALACAFWELRHQHVLGDVLTALRTRDIEPVLFKGTALAYGLYANPVWRERSDTDMIVAEQDWRRASDTLISLGFRRNAGVSGEFVSYQDSYTKESEGGGRHTIDLHRRINNSELLSRLFSYAELRAEACQLPALCEGAWAAGPVHALLLACLHPATHKYNPYYVDDVAQYGGDRLIWHYDVHLLAESLVPAQWQDFVDRATSKGLCATSLEALERAATRFRTRYPDIVREALAKTREPVAVYLKAGRLRQSWIDFSSLPRAADRLQFARELIFPPPAYMRAKYEQSPDAWLLWLYVRRAARGLLKRLKRVRQAND